MIWKVTITPENFNARIKGTMLEAIGLEFVSCSADSLAARIPLDHRTIQPYGILHGGATAALAETLGSVASEHAVDQPGIQKVVGIELNINHLSQSTSGWVTGTVTPIRIGRRLHVWDIRNVDESGKLISVARLTTMVV